MKVTHSDTAALAATGHAASVASTTAAARARTSGHNTSDRVQLSSLSSHLRELVADGQRAHVEKLEAAVSSGNYKPSSHATSARLIAHSMRSAQVS